MAAPSLPPAAGWGDVGAAQAARPSDAAAIAAPIAVGRTNRCLMSEVDSRRTPPVAPRARPGDNRPVTILCLASYDKGHDFLREAHNLGCRVLLVTSESLRDAAWPRESIDETFYMRDVDKQWKVEELLLGVSHLARREAIDRIVPLDDFDLEKASALREHLRVPGMGETTTRYFRDKLAMRVKAASDGIPVPGFVHILNEDRIRAFCRQVEPPWFLKPRQQAGAIGIRKIANEQALWEAIAELGDRSSHYLLETYVAGHVYHVDSIVYEREIRMAVASRYGTPPFDVSHGGGVFTSRVVERGTDEDRGVLELNRRVLASLGLVRGVSHSEYIRRTSGDFVFLETSARVGGAHLNELVEAATGVNLWAEWARVEKAGGNEPYEVRAPRAEYAGLIVSLARQERPSLADYADPEVVWKLDKRHHAGLIVRSPSHRRVEQLLGLYSQRFAHDFVATLPPKLTASD
jgi:biotin carboxylase